VVRKRFRTEIQEDLVRSVLQAAVREAVEQHQLEPIAPPVVRSLDVDPDDTLRAVAELEVRPRLSLSRVRGFVVERPPAAVDPSAGDRVLERLREERALVHRVDRPAARGDVVLVEVSPLEGAGEPQSYEILLGAGRADPRVEAALEGGRAGEERTIELEEAEPSPLSAPEARAEALPALATEADQGGGAGTRLSTPAAPVVKGSSRVQRYRTRIREVKERALPPLDDAFAAQVSTAGALDDLRRQIDRNLREEAEERAEREVRERLVDAIAEANRVEVPEGMVETYVERMLHPEPGGGAGGPHGEGRAGHAHGTGARGAEPHAHDPRLLEVLRPAAERSLRRHLIVEAVARAERLEPSDEQVDQYLRERLAEGGSIEDARRALERKGQLDDLRHHLRAENVFAYLKSQSTIRPSEGSAPAEPAG
jgi:trigger factor